MRLVQLAIDEERRTAVLGALDEENIDYTVAASHPESESAAIVSFPIPADGVEEIFDDLFEAGVREDEYLVVTDAEVAMTANYEGLQDQYAETPNRLAPRSLRSKVRNLRKNTRAFVWMMLLSTTIATAGLLIGSPAVVVGSMVIAPIVGPALAAAVGAVRADRALLMDGIVSQAIGLGIAIVGATAVGLAFRFLAVAPPELELASLDLIRVRLAPSFLSMIVGLAAGAAAAYGLATKGQASILGVMIAAALIPTAAAVGVGVAWVTPTVAIGALVLLLLNITAINVAAYAIFVYLGYRPEADDTSHGEAPYGGSKFAGSSYGTIAVGAAVILVVAAVLTVGVGTYQQSSFERGVNDEVATALTEEPYGELGVEEIRHEYAGFAAPVEPTSVTVVVAQPAGEEYPELAATLHERIQERTGKEIAVRVQFVEYEMADEPVAEDRMGSRISVY